MTAFYYCAVIREPNSIELETKAATVLGPQEVLVKLHFCGICGTDLAIYSGRRAKELPYYPGHEYSGIIEAIGTQVSGLQVGDRVTANPNYVCGKCDFCLREMYNLCENRDTTFFSNGAMAEYLAIDASAVYRLPDNLDFKTATLTEPLACALTGIESRPIEYADVILILGAGMMGLCYLEVLLERNVEATIVVAEPVDAKRQLALDLGADIAAGHQVTDVEEAIHKLGKNGSDLVIECSGSIEAVKNAIHLVRCGGTVLLVGRTGDDESILIYPASIARSGVTISGSVRLTPKNFERALEWLAKRRVKAQNLLGKVFSLSEVQAAFDFALTRQDVKVLLDCQLT